MEATAAPAAPEIFGRRALKAEEKVFVASQWRLMWLHFTRHRLAMVGLWVIIALYSMVILHGFVAPYEKGTRSPFIFRPPQTLHFSDGQGFSLRPFVYGTPFLGGQDKVVELLKGLKANNPQPTTGDTKSQGLLVAGEFGGGLLLAAGLFVPFAAFAIIAVMLVAIATTHWRNGFWNGAGGYEFNLLILVGAAALAATGGGRFSLDRAFGWDDNLSGLWWGVGALGTGALAALFMLTLARRPEPRAIAGVDSGETLRTA